MIEKKLLAYSWGLIMSEKEGNMADQIFMVPALTQERHEVLSEPYKKGHFDN